MVVMLTARSRRPASRRARPAPHPSRHRVQWCRSPASIEPWFSVSRLAVRSGSTRVARFLRMTNVRRRPPCPLRLSRASG